MRSRLRCWKRAKMTIGRVDLAGADHVVELAAVGCELRDVAGEEVAALAVEEIQIALVDLLGQLVVDRRAAVVRLLEDPARPCARWRVARRWERSPREAGSRCSPAPAPSPPARAPGSSGRRSAIQPEDRRRFLDIVSGLAGSVHFGVKARGCSSPSASANTDSVHVTRGINHAAAHCALWRSSRARPSRWLRTDPDLGRDPCSCRGGVAFAPEQATLLQAVAVFTLFSAASAGSLLGDLQAQPVAFPAPMPPRSPMLGVAVWMYWPTRETRAHGTLTRPRAAGCSRRIGRRAGAPGASGAVLRGLPERLQAQERFGLAARRPRARVQARSVDTMIAGLPLRRLEGRVAA